MMVSQIMALRCAAKVSASNGWCSASVPPRHQPWHQRAGEAGERRHRQRRQDHRIAPDLAFEQDGETAGHQLGMTARDRHRAVRRHVPGDDGKVCAGARQVRTLCLGGGQGIERLGVVEIVEPDHTVGRLAAEAANEADRKGLGGKLHREREMIDRAHPPAHDQGVGADTVERRHRLGAPPQQRQRHRD